MMAIKGLSFTSAFSAFGGPYCGEGPVSMTPFCPLKAEGAIESLLGDIADTTSCKSVSLPKRFHARKPSPPHGICDDMDRSDNPQAIRN
jgi:hypothetical protein